jgi:hypothetical protein
VWLMVLLESSAATVHLIDNNQAIKKDSWQPQKIRLIR